VVGHAELDELANTHDDNCADDVVGQLGEHCGGEGKSED
jgi:hypothetical protein